MTKKIGDVILDVNNISLRFGGVKALTDISFNVREHEGKFRNARMKKQWDTTGTIQVVQYKPNYIKYKSNNEKDALAVFSEIYYKNGWNAYIDGKLTDHFPVDYVLRAMEIPGGEHTIEFKFEPQVVKTGSVITLASCIGMLLLLIGGVYFEKFFRKDSQRNHGDTLK